MGKTWCKRHDQFYDAEGSCPFCLPSTPKPQAAAAPTCTMRPAGPSGPACGAAPAWKWTGPGAAEFFCQLHHDACAKYYPQWKKERLAPATPQPAVFSPIGDGFQPGAGAGYVCTGDTGNNILCGQPAVAFCQLCARARCPSHPLAPHHPVCGNRAFVTPVRAGLVMCACGTVTIVLGQTFMVGGSPDQHSAAGCLVGGYVVPPLRQVVLSP